MQYNFLLSLTEFSTLYDSKHCEKCAMKGCIQKAVQSYDQWLNLLASRLFKVKHEKE